METTYGKYPKRMICGCNAEDTNQELVTISLNDRCHVCNELMRICIPKKEIKATSHPLESHAMRVA